MSVLRVTDLVSTYPEQKAPDIEKLMDRVEAQIKDTEAYIRTKADIMLALCIDAKAAERGSLTLVRREKAVYKEKGRKTDIALHSAIIIPSDEEIASFFCYDIQEADKNPRLVRFADQFCVKEDELSRTLDLLFSRIKSYENQRIAHPAGYTAHGVGRKAHISITGMGQLRNFNRPEGLRLLPDVYHTMDEIPHRSYFR